MKNKIISIVLSLSIILSLFAGLELPAFAAANPASDFTYKVINTNQIVITGYVGAYTTVEIPSTIYGKSVTSIGISAFSYDINLQSITIPSSVTSIGDNAFDNCTALTSISIPSSVTSIGYRAFFGCRGLTSFSISSSVTSIGYGAFSGCTGLTSINVDANNKNYLSQDGVLFDINKTILIQYLAGKTQTAYNTIPSTVTTIGDSSFIGCEKLTSITIPNGVTTIESSAFYYCTNLASITIPDSVISIGYDAFGNTAWYENQGTGVVIYAGSIAYTYEGTMPANAQISLKPGTKIINDDCFLHQENLKSITIPSSVTTIGDYAFADCTALTSISIPSTVTSIGYGAFRYCYGLLSITIPSSVTTIEDAAFSECSRLTSLDVDPNNKNFSSQDGVLFDINKTILIQYPAGNINSSYTIPSTVTTIGNSSFSGCENLTSITIPSTVTTIGNCAFYFCQSLKTVNITNANNIISVGGGAFWATAWLDSQPDGVVYVGKIAYTYKGDVFPTSITINNGTKSIADMAFFYFDTLKSVTIPNTVTSIGNRAFYFCTGLTNITIPSSVKTIGEGAFGECTSLTSVSIPTSVTSIGEAAFENCTSLNIKAYKNSYADNYAMQNNIPVTYFTDKTALDSAIATASSKIQSSYTTASWQALQTVLTSAKALQTNADPTQTEVDKATSDLNSAMTSLVNKFNYTIINTNQIEITKYNDTFTTVTIPSMLDGKPVTSIASGAFSDIANLTVSIPDSVKAIVTDAFKNCTGLTIRAFTGSYAITFATTNNIAYVELKYILGDPNADTKIDGKDIAAIVMHITKVKTLADTAFSAGDVNKDGKIDGKDIAAIVMHITKVKLITG